LSPASSMVWSMPRSPQADLFATALAAIKACYRYHQNNSLVDFLK
jgi:hypothetical protein